MSTSPAIAGRAPPDSKVSIYDGEVLLGVVIADPSGEWVFVPLTPLGPGSHSLSLRATTRDGLTIVSELLKN